MKIQPIKRFILEEFPKELRAVLDKIFQPLNIFMEQTVSLTNNGITVGENLKAQVFELIIYGQDAPQSRSWKLNQKPLAVWEVDIVEMQGATGLIPAHSLKWTFQGDSVEFKFNGLTSNVKYRITLIGLC